MGLSFKDEFFKKLGKIEETRFLKNLTSEAGTIAVNFSKKRFRKKNWIDGSINPWKPRKKKSNGSTLVKSGRLKRSIRKISSGKLKVLIGTDVPYAQIHNEGGTIKKRVNVRSHNRGNGRKRKNARVRAHTRKMNLKIPKRQFLGNSKLLAFQIEKHMHKKITKELK